MITIKARESLSIQAAEAIILNNEPFDLDGESLRQVEESLNFLLDFSVEKIIYGINTGFGPMAQYKIEDNKQVELQYNVIRSHSAGAGEKIPDIYVKAAMLVRILSIMQGKSGIHPSCSNETLRSTKGTFRLCRGPMNCHCVPSGNTHAVRSASPC